jgi:hypothetical protein
MNQDEATKCIQIACKAINEQNWDKAKRFLVKSVSLYETEEA